VKLLLLTAAILLELSSIHVEKIYPVLGLQVSTDILVVQVITVILLVSDVDAMMN